MPSLSERIKEAVAREQAKQIQFEERRKRQEEEEKRVLGEGVGKCKSLMDKLGALPQLEEINREILSNKAETKLTCGISSCTHQRDEGTGYAWASVSYIVRHPFCVASLSLKGNVLFNVIVATNEDSTEFGITVSKEDFCPLCPGKGMLGSEFEKINIIDAQQTTDTLRVNSLKEKISELLIQETVKNAKKW